MLNRKKIYISSTFLDLAPYRNAALKALRSDSIKEYITVKSAESADPTDELVWDRVAKDVKACDYYFILLANRYGDIYESPLNSERISYTEHEFRVAVSNDKKIVVFRSGDETLEQFSDKDKNGNIDVEKQSKLNKLKAHEKLQRYGPGMFSNPEALEIQVLHAIFHIVFPHLSHKSYIHLCCNRSLQIQNFKYSINNATAFSAFIIYGEERDMGKDLVKRICFRELDMTDEGSVKIPSVDLNELMMSPSFEITATSLLSNFSEQLYGIRLAGKSIEEMVTAFINQSQKAGKYLVLRIDVTAGMLEPLKIDFLHYFISICSQNFSSTLTSKLYVFLNISDRPAFNQKMLSRIFYFIDAFFIHSKTNKKVAAIMNGVKDGIPCCFDTRRMGKVEKRHILNWLTNDLGIDEWIAHDDLKNKLSVLRKGVHDMIDVQKILHRYLNTSQ